MALKQEIWWLNRIWVEHPIFWDGNNQKTTTKQKPMWLPVLKPSKNHKSRIRKIYFIYRYRLGNKNSRHLFLVHFCMSLLWHPCHNSVIQNKKSPTGTQWLQKLTFWKKETPAKPQQQAFSITATINDTKLI